MLGVNCTLLGMNIFAIFTVRLHKFRVQLSSYTQVSVATLFIQAFPLMGEQRSFFRGNTRNTDRIRMNSCGRPSSYTRTFSGAILSSFLHIKPRVGKDRDVTSFQPSPRNKQRPKIHKYRQHREDDNRTVHPHPCHHSSHHLCVVMTYLTEVHLTENMTTVNRR